MDLQRVDLFCFDLDGCVYRGHLPDPSAIALISELRQREREIMFVTNNSIDSSRTIAERLAVMGIEASMREVVAVTEYAGEYITARCGRSRIAVAGSRALRAGVARHGHVVIPLTSAGEGDLVLLGLDLEFGYDSLALIGCAIHRGARVIAANIDGHHPGPDESRVLETGCLAAAVERLCDLSQIESIGKPARFLFDVARRSTSSRSDAAVMVGDSLTTDVAGALAAGMGAIWLAHGRPHPKVAPLPDLCVESMEHLLTLTRTGASI